MNGLAVMPEQAERREEGGDREEERHDAATTAPNASTRMMRLPAG